MCEACLLHILPFLTHAHLLSQEKLNLIKKQALKLSSKEGYEVGNSAVVFGIVAEALNLSDKESTYAMMYVLARDMVSAATRLNMVGPLVGQSILADLDRYIVAIVELVQEGGEVDVDLAFTGGGVGEGLASAHERLYSRLFNS